MHHRDMLVGSAVALLVSAAFAAIPAAATPCTNLSGLQLQHTTITSATDNDSGTFVPPGGTPLTGLPAFCRVTATLTPMSNSAIKIEVCRPTWAGPRAIATFDAAARRHATGRTRKKRNRRATPRSDWPRRQNGERYND